MQCPVCGNANREEARFCDSCGAKLDTVEPTPELASQPGAPAPGEAVPQRVDRFAIERLLGRGGRKDVYLARDERDGGEVAVALFDTAGLGEAALVRARREMQAMERLGKHPHVHPVTETGEVDGRPYLVSPYLPGGDVQRLLAESPERRLGVARAVEIAIDVCRALEHAHSRGVVHRDLKPANVWLDRDGRARLGDFGLAVTGTVRASGALVGTVAYVAPEQALGRSSGPRSDLYSLGAMLYEMVAGRPPFVGDDAVSIIGQHLNSDPVAPSHHDEEVPPALDELIAELLAKLPEARPESAAAVRARLEAIRDAPAVEPAAAGPESGENPLEALAGGVFVGREQELAELRGAADEALGGRGRLVLLAGEPGIGKTRTAEELATYAQVRGAKVHWGRCHEGDGAPPYWPWVQVIRSYAREADPVALAWEVGAGASEITRVVPELAERLGAPPAPEGEDEQARFRLFDAVSGFLANAASSRPLVVALDDLHWADEPSLLLLEFLARELGSAPLLVVGSYRDVELGRHHPLSRVLGELAQSERAQRVALRGLAEPDIARFVEISAGVRAPAQLVAAVHARTEGNPFFVGEVVRLLASEGRLESAGDGAVAIPEGVRDVVGRRLDRLSPAANETLRTAAAIGRDFEQGVLANVTGGDAASLRGALEEAVAAQLLVERAPERFRFAHALVRETLYEELTAAQRPALHSRIAAAMEEAYSADPARLERRLAELAHHYVEAGAAGDPEKAVEYATRAGERAIAQLGYEEAAELFERALEALELGEGDSESRCRLLVALGEAQTNGGHIDRARPTMERAAEEAKGCGSPELLARAALGVAYTTEVGGFDPRIAALLEAAREAIGPEDSTTRALLTSWLGQEHYWRDPQGRSAELHREAIEMARRLGDERTLAHVLSRANFIDITAEAARRGVEENSEVLELARRVGDRELELRCHVVLARDHLQLGDIAAVDREIAAFARVAEELRQPHQLWRVDLLRAMRALIDGRFGDAERLAAEARRGGEAAGEPAAQQFFAVQASLVYRFQGRLGEIVDAVDAMAERYPAIRAWRVARSMISSDLGRLDQARTEFERLAAENFDGLPLDAQWTVAHAMLCEVAFALDDGERAELLHRHLDPYRGLALAAGPAAACWGPVARYLGLASAAAGDFARAVEELEEAIALSRRMGDRPFAAQGELNLAQVLLRRGAAGDRERALELLDSCLACSQELRMAGIAEQALSLKLDIQGLTDVDVTSSIDDVIDAVEIERPDVRAYAAADGTVTILFSDIESSTTMTERLGDERWLEVLRDHNAVFRERLRSHGGYEVKNQGDGFMIVFPDPLAALRCAIDVQRAFEERAERAPEEQVRVRMGLHTGEAIAEEGDFFGRNVILAARIAAQATGGEILVSEALREQAAEDALAFDEGRELELKGLAGTHRVYRAEWEAQAAQA